MNGKKQRVFRCDELEKRIQDTPYGTESLNFSEILKEAEIRARELKIKLRRPFKRIFCGTEYRLKKVSFGNIFKEPFKSIWNNKGYIEFREIPSEKKEV